MLLFVLITQYCDYMWKLLVLIECSLYCLVDGLFYNMEVLYNTSSISASGNIWLGLHYYCTWQLVSDINSLYCYYVVAWFFHTLWFMFSHGILYIMGECDSFP